jgi:hypothetical protein
MVTIICAAGLIPRSMLFARVAVAFAFLLFDNKKT